MDKVWAYLASEFGYTQRQGRSVLMLLLVCVLIVLVPTVYKKYQRNNLHVSKIRIDAESRSIAAASKLYNDKKIAKSRVIALHTFDPNVASVAELEGLGIPAFLAKRIEKYRLAGGRFKDAQSIAKIYDFPTELADTLKPYIHIRNLGSKNQVSVSNHLVKAQYSSERSFTTSRESKPLVDINLADSAQLEALPGVGEYTARNIIKYRTLLGGYVSLNQLYELYNQDSARTKFYSQFLRVNQSMPTVKIELVNDYNARQYHPYLKGQPLKLLRAYLKQHGAIKTEAEFRQATLLGDKEIEKLRPYLPF